MAKQLLSEPEAWREIARLSDVGRVDFMCLTADLLAAISRISDATNDRMHARVMAHLRPGFGTYFSTVYFDTPDEEQDDWLVAGPSTINGARVLAALWLALEAEAEEATNGNR